MCHPPFDICVVGGGIAGSAAALRAVQYSLRTLWIRGDRTTVKGSRAAWVVNIDNMIGIHDGIVRKKIARSLRGEQFAAARERIEQDHTHIGTLDIVRNTLERIEAGYSEFIEIVAKAADSARRDGDRLVIGAGDREYEATSVVLATGVMDRQPQIKKATGEVIVDDIKWIYPFANHESALYCIRCEGHLTSGTPTTVIGHLEDSAYVAMMLHERYRSVTSVLTNGEEPEWDDYAQSVLDAYGISAHRARIVDLEGERGQLHTALLEDGTELRVRFAFVSLGYYRVYNDLAIQLGAELTNPEEPIETRHVKIDQRGETTAEGLFAVGDMARRDDEGVMKQVYTSQEYAVRAVDTIDGRLRRQRRAQALEAAGKTMERALAAAVEPAIGD